MKRKVCGKVDIAVQIVEAKDMSIGQIARRVLGKYFPYFGRIYRSFFVNLDTVAKSISPHIPEGASLIDVGGGDGVPLNYLLALRQDITVKLIDLRESVGNSINQEYLNRVELYPETGMKKFSTQNEYTPDVILMSDVIHHIPLGNRKEFFSELKAMAGDSEEIRIIIKDLEPGHLRATLGGLADRYISGDKNVSLIGRGELSALMSETFGKSVTVEETDLFDHDKPNYALVFICKQIDC